MSGRRIDDRKFWAGGNGTKFPEGAKSKEYSSAEGAGELNRYEDTTEAVKKQQEIGKGKVKSHPQKEHFRY